MYKIVLYCSFIQHLKFGIVRTILSVLLGTSFCTYSAASAFSDSESPAKQALHAGEKRQTLIERTHHPPLLLLLATLYVIAHLCFGKSVSVFFYSLQVC